MFTLIADFPTSVFLPADTSPTHISAIQLRPAARVLSQTCLCSYNVFHIPHIFSKDQHLRSQALKYTTAGTHLFWLKPDLTRWDLHRRCPRETHQMFFQFSKNGSYLWPQLFPAFHLGQPLSLWLLAPGPHYKPLYPPESHSFHAIFIKIKRTKCNNSEIFMKFLIEDTALIHHRATSTVYSAFTPTPLINIIED